MYKRLRTTSLKKLNTVITKKAEARSVGRCSYSLHSSRNIATQSFVDRRRLA